MGHQQFARQKALPSPASRVGVASFHPIVARFLCEFVKKSRELRQIVGSAGSINLADSNNLHKESFTTILVDTVSANCDPRRISRKMLTRYPGCKLIALTLSREEDVIGILQSGFVAVVQVTDKLDHDLISAITAVLSGSVWAPESVICDYSKRMQWLLRSRLTPDQRFTPRESQIVDLVMYGRSTKDIAGSLGITQRTVKFHMSNILSKTGADGRRELVKALSGSCEGFGGVEASLWRPES